MRYGRIVAASLVACLPFVLGPTRRERDEGSAGRRLVRLSGEVTAFSLTTSGPEEAARARDDKLATFLKDGEEVSRVERELRSPPGERPSPEKTRRFLHDHLDSLLSVEVAATAEYARSAEPTSDAMAWPFRRT